MQWRGYITLVLPCLSSDSNKKQGIGAWKYQVYLLTHNNVYNRNRNIYTNAEFTRSSSSTAVPLDDEPKSTGENSPKISANILAMEAKIIKKTKEQVILTRWWWLFYKSFIVCVGVRGR